MALKHNNLPRFIHRFSEEIYCSLLVAMKTHPRNFFTILNAKIINYIINKRCNPETDLETKCLIKKHGILLEYFEKQYQEFIRNYSFNKNSIPEDSKYKNKIWVCWWQGYDNAPKLVQSCIESIKKNSENNEVIIIDDNNYRKYVNIPTWLEEKKNKGIISKTHFSDYLRLSLLSTHGGVWLDSTFFCSGPCFEDIFKLPVWSIKRPGCDHLSIAGGYFANFSFGCDFSNRKVFAIIRDYLEE